MDNESKTLRNVCVPRLLRGAGGNDKKSYDTVGESGPGAGTPASCGRCWAVETACVLGRGGDVSGTPGGSFYPPWLGLHAMVCGRG